MISLKYLALLFVIYSVFNLLTIHFSIRIKDRVIPQYVFGIYLYYLILLTYIFNLVEQYGPMRNMDIIIEISFFAFLEVVVILFFVHQELDNINNIDNKL